MTDPQRLDNAIAHWESAANSYADNLKQYHFNQDVAQGLRIAKELGDRPLCGCLEHTPTEPPATTEDAIAQFFGLSEELSEVQHYAAQKLKALEEVMTNLGRTLENGAVYSYCGEFYRYKSSSNPCDRDQIFIPVS